MKLLFVAVLISFSCVIADKYTSRYDKVDLDEILSNKRLLAGYMKCTLEQGACTPEGKELKYYIIDALKTGCEKCSDYHRQSIKKVIKHLVKHEPQFWEQAIDKYDPDRIYIKKYETEIKDS